MEKIKQTTAVLYHHHLIRYLFVGGTTFLINIGLLIFCHSSLNLRIEIATTIAYWTSVIYNFCLNRWWTFSASEEKALHEHALLYGVLLAVNYVFNLIFVTAMSHVIHYSIAQVLSTGIQIIWTYPVYKNVIFKRSSS